MKTVTAKYARQNFAEVINEVHYTGKPIQITKSGKPMVVIISTKNDQNKKKGKKLEIPNKYPLRSLKQTDKEMKQGKVTSFNNWEEALTYLDKEIADEKNRRMINFLDKCAGNV